MTSFDQVCQDIVEGRTAFARCGVSRFVREPLKKSAIRRYREKNGRMSLEEFGKLLTPHVDKSTVLRWELGRISPYRAVEVESATGIPRAELRPDIFGIVRVAGNA